MASVMIAGCWSGILTAGHGAGVGIGSAYQASATFATPAIAACYSGIKSHVVVIGVSAGSGLTARYAPAAAKTIYGKACDKYEEKKLYFRLQRNHVYNWLQVRRERRANKAHKKKSLDELREAIVTTYIADATASVVDPVHLSIVASLATDSVPSQKEVINALLALAGQWVLRPNPKGGSEPVMCYKMNGVCYLATPSSCLMDTDTLRSNPFTNIKCKFEALPPSPEMACLSSMVPTVCSIIDYNKRTFTIGEPDFAGKHKHLGAGFAMMSVCSKDDKGNPVVILVTCGHVAERAGNTISARGATDKWVRASVFWTYPFGYVGKDDDVGVNDVACCIIPYSWLAALGRKPLNPLTDLSHDAAGLVQMTYLEPPTLEYPYGHGVTMRRGHSSESARVAGLVTHDVYTGIGCSGGECSEITAPHKLSSMHLGAADGINVGINGATIFQLAVEVGCATVASYNSICFPPQPEAGQGRGRHYHYDGKGRAVPRQSKAQHREMIAKQNQDWLQTQKRIQDEYDDRTMEQKVQEERDNEETYRLTEEQIRDRLSGGSAAAQYMARYEAKHYDDNGMTSDMYSRTNKRGQPSGSYGGDAQYAAPRVQWGPDAECAGPSEIAPEADIPADKQPEAAAPPNQPIHDETGPTTAGPSTTLSIGETRPKTAGPPTTFSPECATLVPGKSAVTTPKVVIETPLAVVIRQLSDSDIEAVSRVVQMLDNNPGWIPPTLEGSTMAGLRSLQRIMPETQPPSPGPAPTEPAKTTSLRHVLNSPFAMPPLYEAESPCVSDIPMPFAAPGLTLKDVDVEYDSDDPETWYSKATTTRPEPEALELKGSWSPCCIPRMFKRSKVTGRNYVVSIPENPKTVPEVETPLAPPTDFKADNGLAMCPMQRLIMLRKLEFNSATHIGGKVVAHTVGRTVEETRTGTIVTVTAPEEEDHTNYAVALGRLPEGFCDYYDTSDPYDGRDHPFAPGKLQGDNKICELINSFIREPLDADVKHVTMDSTWCLRDLLPLDRLDGRGIDNQFRLTIGDERELDPDVTPTSCWYQDHPRTNLPRRALETISEMISDHRVDTTDIDPEEKFVGPHVRCIINEREAQFQRRAAVLKNKTVAEQRAFYENNPFVMKPHEMTHGERSVHAPVPENPNFPNREQWNPRPTPPVFFGMADVQRELFGHVIEPPPDPCTKGRYWRNHVFEEPRLMAKSPFIDGLNVVPPAPQEDKGTVKDKVRDIELRIQGYLQKNNLEAAMLTARELTVEAFETTSIYQEVQCDLEASGLVDVDAENPAYYPDPDNPGERLIVKPIFDASGREVYTPCGKTRTRVRLSNTTDPLFAEDVTTGPCLSDEFVEIYNTLREKHSHLKMPVGATTDFTMPPTGLEAGDAAFHSVRAQAKSVGMGDLSAISERRFRKAWNRYLRHSSSVRVDQCFKHTFDEFLPSLDGDKSAGWSQIHKNGPKEVWKKDPDALWTKVANRMIARVVYRDRIPLMTPYEMVKAGICDPKIISPKKEGHILRKVKEGKWRSIWVCSIVDLMCEALSQYTLNKQQIRDFQKGDRFCGAALGVGHDAAGVKLLTAAIEKIRTSSPNGQIGSADASGWDMSITREDLLVAADLRATCTVAETPLHAAAIELALRLQAHIASSHCFMMGRVVFQCNFFGIIDSGRLSTSADTTIIRLFLSYVCGAIIAMSTGDDLIWAGDFEQQLFALCGKVSRDLTYVDPRVNPVCYNSHEFRLLTPAGEEGADTVWEFTRARSSFQKMLANLYLKNINKPAGRPSQDSINGILNALDGSVYEEYFIDFCEQFGWPRPRYGTLCQPPQNWEETW